LNLLGQESWPSGCGSARAGYSAQPNYKELVGEKFRLQGQSAASALWKSRLKYDEPANFAGKNKNSTSNTRRKQAKTMIDRESAWCLLTEFTQSESLRKHALAVEACMRAYARKFSENEELWGEVGLLHDFDYEKYPSAQEHPYTFFSL